jgi:hypothetical protein
MEENMPKAYFVVVVCLVMLVSSLTGCFREAQPQAEDTGIDTQSIVINKPINGGELALGTDPSVTFNVAMNTATVERSINIFPATYDPSKNPATFTKLQLTSM